jgi:hypothetical protein
MATQPQTDSIPQTKIRAAAYAASLFGPRRSSKPVVIVAAVDRLLDVYKTDPDQRPTVAKVLARVRRERLVPADRLSGITLPSRRIPGRRRGSRR